MSFFKDKHILVTGAGGSIGSELCWKIIRQYPSKLVLFDNSELALYNIDKDLAAADWWMPDMPSPPSPVVPVLGDVSNFNDVDRLFHGHEFDFIFHAAAYKHVRMCEENSGPAWRVNVEGTTNILRRAYGARFVLVSTDKAVNPTSLMGQTKRRAEEHTRRAGHTVIRLGNVRGSSGSVLPLWKEQIAAGAPVTITDPNATRYMISASYAADCIIKAAALEPGTYVPDMGAPVRIGALACLHGAKNFKVIGLQPGEKMHEELFAGERAKTNTPGIWRDAA